jgi:hypothetical protein
MSDLFDKSEIHRTGNIVSLKKIDSLGYVVWNNLS